MNRPERRAAEAQARQNFADYSSLYRRAFEKVDDREIGEGWMRGAAAEADGIDGMIIHPPNETPPHRDQCDMELSAAYGSQRFLAYAKSEHLAALESGWPTFIEAERRSPESLATDDMRHDARDFIFSMILTNRAYENGTNAALTASAILWLAKGSPVKLVIGERHKRIHYEISEMGTAPNGRKMRNFRLILGS